jgi:hypothetical protein
MLARKNSQPFWLLTILAIGIALRLVMPMRGSNFDMESYRIVADIVAKGGDVYSETSRYNYGPIWFHILHALDALPWTVGDKLTALHWKVACFLTLVDVGICLSLFRRYGVTVAALFFLNPISIMITGYHSQFENFAILLGIVSVGMLDREKGTKWIWGGLIVLGLSLSVKHILFLFPLWLAFKQKCWSRKLLFVGVPYAIFLGGFSFYLPRDAHQILKNVFLYRSWNNAPLWTDLAPGFVRHFVPSFALFVATMLILGLLWRPLRAIESLHFYLISLVAFSSAIANQYLAICIPSIATQWNWAYGIYTFIGTAFLLVDHDGLHLHNLQNVLRWDGKYGYDIVVLPLFIGLVLRSINKAAFEAMLTRSQNAFAWLVNQFNYQIKAPW